jgi:hypothetical protein
VRESRGIRSQELNTLYYGDNLDVLRRYVKDETGGRSSSKRSAACPGDVMRIGWAGSDPRPELVEGEIRAGLRELSEGRLRDTAAASSYPSAAEWVIARTLEARSRVAADSGTAVRDGSEWPRRPWGPFGEGKRLGCPPKR